MGDSHWRSNIKGQDGTQSLSGFAQATLGNVDATNLHVTTNATINTLAATYLKVLTTATIATISANDIVATDCDFDYVKVNTTATIAAISANTVTATSLRVNAGVGNYIKLGSHQYILFGGETTESEIVADATAIDASVKGSLYMSTGGSLWVLDGDDTATKFQTY